MSRDEGKHHTLGGIGWWWRWSWCVCVRGAGGWGAWGLTARGVFHLSKSDRWATPPRHQLIKGATQHHLFDLLRKTEVYAEMSRCEKYTLIREYHQLMHLLNSEVKNPVQMCQLRIQSKFYVILFGSQHNFFQFVIVSVRLPELPGSYSLLAQQ